MDKQKYEENATIFIKVALSFLRDTFPALQDFTCTLKCDWSEDRRFSRGGKYAKGPGVNLAMHPLVTNHMEKGRFREYKSIAADPYIGSIKSDKPIYILSTLMCHEIAHAITHYLGQNDTHGPKWQFWYRVMRERFVNHEVTPLVTITEETVSSSDPKYTKDTFVSNCRSHGLKPEHFGSSFEAKGKNYEVVGWNPNARKHYVLLKQRENGKGYHCPPAQLKRMVVLNG